MNERHLKIVYLKDKDIVAILNWRHEDAGTLLVLCGPQVPEDARVHHCFYDAERMSTAVVLYHDSFAEVPEGCKTPVMEPEGNRVLRKCAEGSLELVDNEVREEPGFFDPGGPHLFKVNASDPVTPEMVSEAQALEPEKEDFRNHRYLGTHFTSGDPKVEAESVKHRYAALATHPQNVVTNILSEGNGQFLIEFYERVQSLNNAIHAFARSAAESAHPELWEGLQGSSQQGLKYNEPEEEESSGDWFRRIMGNG